ncbi:hypothetical protein IAU59_005142 [Kwoniella sp. CBS 9459]
MLDHQQEEDIDVYSEPARGLQGTPYDADDKHLELVTDDPPHDGAEQSYLHHSQHITKTMPLALTSQIPHPHIMTHVLSYMSTPTLATMMRVSKELAAMAMPFFWDDITLDLNSASAKPCHPLLYCTPSYPGFLTAAPQEKDHDTGTEGVVDPRHYVRRLTIAAHYDGQPHGTASSRQQEQQHQNAHDEVTGSETGSHPVPTCTPMTSTLATSSSLSAEAAGPFPNLHTLHLAIHPKSPIGWSFCKPSDRGRYPVYPASSACPLLSQLRPKRLVISGIPMLDSPSPFPLPTAHPSSRTQGRSQARQNQRNEEGNLWDRVQEVVLIVDTSVLVKRVTPVDDSSGPYRDGRDNFLRTIPESVKDLKIVFTRSTLPRPYSSPETASSALATFDFHAKCAGSVSLLQVELLNVVEAKIEQALSKIRKECKVTLVGMESFITQDYANLMLHQRFSHPDQFRQIVIAAREYCQVYGPCKVPLKFAIFLGLSGGLESPREVRFVPFKQWCRRGGGEESLMSL